MTDATTKKTKTKKIKTILAEMSHDVFWRRCMSNKVIATEFLEFWLPQINKNILKEIDLSTLKLEKCDFADKILGKGYSDMLYSVQWNNQKGYIFILTEHQSKPDKLMSFRLMKYMLKICDLHLNHDKNAKLPSIMPLVVYTGKEPYNVPRSFFDLFQNLKQAKQFFSEPAELFSLRDIKDIPLRNKYHMAIVLNLMRHIHEKEIFPHVQNLAPFFHFLMQLGLSTAEDVLVYMLKYGKSKNKEKIEQLLIESTPKEYRGHMKTMGEQFREEGVLIGKAEGKAEGKADIVSKMHEKLSSVEISSIIDMPVAEVEKLLRKKFH